MKKTIHMSLLKETIAKLDRLGAPRSQPRGVVIDDLVRAVPEPKEKKDE